GSRERVGWSLGERSINQSRAGRIPEKHAWSSRGELETELDIPGKSYKILSGGETVVSLNQDSFSVFCYIDAGNQHILQPQFRDHTRCSAVPTAVPRNIDQDRRGIVKTTKESHIAEWLNLSLF